MIADAVCIIAAAYAALLTPKVLFPWQVTISTMNFVTTIAIVVTANNYIMGRFRLYSDRKARSILSIVWSITRTIVADFAIISMWVLLYDPLSASRGFFILFLFYSYLFLVGERVIVQLYFDRIKLKRSDLRKVLIVGDLERGSIVAQQMQRQLSWGHQIVGHFTIGKRSEKARSLNTPEELVDILHRANIDEVIFTLEADPSIDLVSYLDKCRVMGVTSRVVPAMWRPGARHMSTEYLQGVPFLTFQTNNFNATGMLYKRILDIVGGMVGTFLFLAMYPFVALAITCDSPGPVMFRQKRVGRNGRIFEVFKFRSMYADAEKRKKELMERNEMEGAIFKIKDDPRITRVGRWLRKTSIDEVPQFLNVLKGEMSLVGTRPPTVDEVEKYQDWQFKRISAKPGITGLWQISGRNEITDFDSIVDLDTQYLENWRFLDDVRILLMTIWVVIRGKGAE